MGIKVNVSEKEQAAGDRGSLPVGRYHCAITDVRLSSPESGENIGKPMLIFEFTVQDSSLHAVPDHNVNAEFLNRKIFTNACLWDGALYTIVQIAKATGDYSNLLDERGDMDVPSEPEFWTGKEVIVRIAFDPKQKARWPENPDYWYPARGFSAPKGATVSNGSSGSSGSGTPVSAEEGALLP